MAEYIYVTNPARLKAFLEKIQGVGIPEKVTLKYLQQLGFKSPNDRAYVSVMKNLGFLSSSGEPIERWKAYRNKRKGPAILAQAIKENYAALYQMYPDAHLKDNEALRNFFSSHTTVGANTLGYMVRTFKTITSLADFKAEVPPLPEQGSAGPSGGITPPIRVPDSSKSEIVLNVNIQLTLPEGSTSETFEDFFKAMRKNLID